MDSNLKLGLMLAVLGGGAALGAKLFALLEAFIAARAARDNSDLGKQVETKKGELNEIHKQSNGAVSDYKQLKREYDDAKKDNNKP